MGELHERRFGDQRVCSCCDAAGTTRRDFLAIGGAMLVSGASPATSLSATAPMPVLDDWMRAYPRFAKAVVWDFGKGAQPYMVWPEPSKAHLRAAYARAWRGEASGLVDPPPDQLTREDHTYPLTALSGANAFTLQAAHVANSLAVEIGRRVPWSAADYSESALASLFDGRQTFTRINHLPDSYTTVLKGVPAPPELCVDFLKSHRLVGATRQATIVQVLAWCRDRLTHFMGAMTAKNVENHWQYRGMPPASRVISGTRYAGADFGASDRRRHFTAGCWGTTSFLAGVLRSVNIPVQQLVLQGMNATDTKVETHSTPHFLTEGLCLSHGDDPYNALARVQPSFEIEQILITKAQHDIWFPAGVTPGPGKKSNVGRRVTELAVKFLPIALLNHHAQDILAKRPPESGQVMRNLKARYTMGELEGAQLWKRLDARIAELGGPEKVRELYAASARHYEQQNIATTVR